MFRSIFKKELEDLIELKEQQAFLMVPQLNIF